MYIKKRPPRSDTSVHVVCLFFFFLFVVVLYIAVMVSFYFHIVSLGFSP